MTLKPRRATPFQYMFADILFEYVLSALVLFFSRAHGLHNTRQIKEVAQT